MFLSSGRRASCLAIDKTEDQFLLIAISWEAAAGRTVWGARVLSTFDSWDEAEAEARAVHEEAGDRWLLCIVRAEPRARSLPEPEAEPEPDPRARRARSRSPRRQRVG